MKKIIKIIFIVIGSIILLYALFIAEECFRLRNGNGRPLIVVSGTCQDDNIVHTSSYDENCIGLGYRIKRGYISYNDSESNIKFGLINEEFWLFDKFLLWGFIS